MSYAREYITRQVFKSIEKIWKDELKLQWRQKERWSDIYRTIDQHIPANSTMLDLGAGDEHVKSLRKHNPEYLSIDFNGKCDITEDLDYQYLDLWQYRALAEGGGRTYGDRPWDIGLLIEVIEYLEQPHAVLDHYKQFANKWIITTRIGRPDHIYLNSHPLKSRWRHWKDFENYLENFFSSVTVTTIDTDLTTCTGRMKPFALAICEV
ncbi:MAG: hypothetical protein ACO3UU_01765 [Minisyncoccia bacterium]